MTPPFDNRPGINDAVPGFVPLRHDNLSDNTVGRIRTFGHAFGLFWGKSALLLSFGNPGKTTVRNLDQPGESRAIDESARRNCLTTLRDPSGLHSEAIRALRTDLLMQRDADDRADTIAILSPCHGEGRSFLAAELAISFAQLGQPTLLVDADLRNPTQHLLFGVDNQQGLSDAIAGISSAGPRSVIGLPQLFLLTAGTPALNPLELLSDPGFDRLISGWRKTYAFVIFDTSAVTRYSDALTIATHSGRVLILSRAQHTHYSDTDHLLRRLTATRSRIAGAVITHF